MDAVAAIKRGRDRVERLLAKVRVKQLESALRGRIEQSARYAQRAKRVRRHAVAEAG